MQKGYYLQGINSNEENYPLEKKESFNKNDRHLWKCIGKSEMRKLVYPGQQTEAYAGCFIIDCQYF